MDSHIPIHIHLARNRGHRNRHTPDHGRKPLHHRKTLSPASKKKNVRYGLPKAVKARRAVFHERGVKPLMVKSLALHELPKVVKARRAAFHHRGAKPLYLQRAFQLKAKRQLKCG